MSFDQLVQRAGVPVIRGEGNASGYRDRRLDRKTLSQYLGGVARPEAVGVSLPPNVRVLEMTLNWPGLIVDTIESRLDVEGFLLSDGEDTDDDLWN